MKLFLTLMTFAISFGLNAQTITVPSQGASKSQSAETHKNASYTFTIIPSVNKTWGYDIFIEKRLYIHQPNAPGLPGNEGFKTKTDAEKVAKLVISKIKKGEMPPSVTIEEMKKLKVL
jgi:hypothetical protein